MNIDLFEQNPDKVQAIKTLIWEYAIDLGQLTSDEFNKHDGFVVSYTVAGSPFQVYYLRDNWSNRLETATVYSDLLVAVSDAVGDKYRHNRENCLYKVSVLNKE